jgi:hypothetical protein
MSKIYNLFISHSWSYSDDYDRLKNLLDNASYFSYRDYSVPKDDPIHNAPSSSELADAIREKMKYCSIVLVMAGKYSTFSKWIKKEIRIAKNDFDPPKAILGIKPFASTQVSSYVSDNADEIVNWSTSSIVAAIKRLCK